MKKVEWVEKRFPRPRDGQLRGTVWDYNFGRWKDVSYGKKEVV